MIRLIVLRPVGAANQPSILDVAHQPRAEHERLRGEDDAGQAPPTRKAHRRLDTGAPLVQVAGRWLADVADEHDRVCPLLQGQQDAYLGREGREDERPVTSRLADLVQSHVDELVDLDDHRGYSGGDRLVDPGMLCAEVISRW